MSATDRQNRLLVAEDWKRIYQTYRNADFQSYDFENLRRVMISYLRDNYPEDFNDYIESSEYVALIDMIAFIGQSISFRTDLNARENFLELAERQDSVLRLARLLSYNPKRNIPASGVLKFVAVQTTQNIYDVNGRNLSGSVINWNDHTNQNWHDQFIKIINAALPTSSQYGNPDDKGLIYGIPTEQYRFQALNTDVPIYKFNKSIDGRTMAFEVVSTTFKNSGEIYEEPPLNGNRLSFLYRDDGRGYGSHNTGFFVHFKQGILSQGSFTVTQPSTNESVDLDVASINNSDIWLYKLDKNGLEDQLWVQVPAFEGNNVIYNSLNKNIKNIYSVVTRANDKVSLMFSDGTFGTIPRGSFKIYYRISNGLTYTINPKDMKNISISIPYVSAVGQVETLTIYANLVSSVDNSSPAETMSSIKANAPATYYTQNRMITGEDYNIAPLSISQEVVKIKAVNRSASGISRFFDLVDPTGKYSKTNLFSDDGALYQEEYSDSFKFSFNTKSDIEHVIYNQLYAILINDQMRDYYYSKHNKSLVGYTNTDNLTFITTQAPETNMSTGYFCDINGPYDPLAYPDVMLDLSSPKMKLMAIGTLVKFRFIDGTAKWTSIVRITSTELVLNDIIPTGAVITNVIPVFKKSFTSGVINLIIDLISSSKPFGLRYDITTFSWQVIEDTNLDLISDFNSTPDVSNRNKDSSWLISITTDPYSQTSTVKYRLLRYIFESDQQIRFFYDSSEKIYDNKAGTIVKDNVNILSINTMPGSSLALTEDKKWEISGEYVGSDGYVDTKKIQLTFADSDDDGIVDNPELFSDVVSDTGYIVTAVYSTSLGLEYQLFDNSNNTVLFVDEEPTDLTSTTEGQHYYIKSINLVKVVALKNNVKELVLSSQYRVYRGRRNLKFQYVHNASHNARIDPGVTNIMDIFVLTKQYDTLYRQWVSNVINEEPLPPSTDYLYNIMSSGLNKIKSIGDEVIYHPVRFKILFGNKATSNVQASFKVVKNGELVISDNDIKTRVLAAMNDFFNLQNWDFGDSFYFSELSAYVMNRVSPYIVNFIIVPRMTDLTFGSLYEIRAEKDQIFINGATVSDIDIITAVTAASIKSSGAIAIEPVYTPTQYITSQGNA